MESLNDGKQLQDVLKKYRNAVNRWKSGWEKANKSKLSGQVSGSGSLASSIKGTVKNREGYPERVGMRFNRYGVYVHLGVGNGYKIAVKGSGVVIKTKPSEGTRTPKPWLNNTLEEKLPELTKIVAHANSELLATGIKHTLSETVILRGL